MPRSHQSPEQLGFFNKLTSTDPVTPRTQESVTALLTETPPVINRARHGAGDTDEAVRHITLMENYYSRLLTTEGLKELKKAQEIIIDTDTVTIAGLKIERENSGNMKEKAASENRDFVPNLDEWQSIIDALPGGEKWHDSLKKILGIDIYESSYWAWDKVEQKMKVVRMSGHNHTRKINHQAPHDAEQRPLVRLIARDSLAQ